MLNILNWKVNICFLFLKTALKLFVWFFQMRFYQGCQNSPRWRSSVWKFLKIVRNSLKCSEFNSIYVNWKQKIDVNPRAKYSRQAILRPSTDFAVPKIHWSDHKWDLVWLQQFCDVEVIKVSFSPKLTR